MSRADDKIETTEEVIFVEPLPDDIARSIVVQEIDADAAQELIAVSGSLVHADAEGLRVWAIDEGD